MYKNEGETVINRKTPGKLGSKRASSYLKLKRKSSFCYVFLLLMQKRRSKKERNRVTKLKILE